MWLFQKFGDRHIMSCSFMSCSYREMTSWQRKNVLIWHSSHLTHVLQYPHKIRWIHSNWHKWHQSHLPWFAWLQKFSFEKFPSGWVCSLNTLEETKCCKYRGCSLRNDLSEFPQLCETIGGSWSHTSHTSGGSIWQVKSSIHTQIFSSGIVELFPGSSIRYFHFQESDAVPFTLICCSFSLHVFLVLKSSFMSLC